MSVAYSYTKLAGIGGYRYGCYGADLIISLRASTLAALNEYLNDTWRCDRSCKWRITTVTSTGRYGDTDTCGTTSAN
jgi:hypothetical protein